MSEKREQNTNVSRETNAGVATPNQIPGRDAPGLPGPAGEGPSGKDPAGTEHVSRETTTQGAPSPAGKNKRSSMYVYLAILFGAAFLMLLLAYFVQQRNNAAVLDNLRSTTASREELLEDIQRLEEENLALKAQAKELQTQLDGLQTQFTEEQERSFWAEKDLRTQLFSWNALWGLEQNFRGKDYEACTQFFQIATTSNYYFTPPEAADRVEEIYRALVEQGVFNEEDFLLYVILSKPPTD